MSDKSFFAALLAFALFALYPPLARAGEPPKEVPTGSDEASQRFRRGVDFYKTKDFAAALVEFKRAYELSPNYRVLFNLGQTSRELNDYASALRAFEQYLNEGGKEVPLARAKDVLGWIAELRKKVGKLTIETNVNGAEVLIDEVSVGKTPLTEPVTVNAGRRRLTATLSGYTPAQRAVDIGGTEEQRVVLELTKNDKVIVTPKIVPPKLGSKPEAKPPLPAWVMLGVTLAAGTATGVMGGLALAARGDLDDALGTFPGDGDAIQAAQSKTRTFAIATDILAGVTAAGAITTTVLFIVHATSSPKDESARAALSIGPGSIGVVGTF